MSAYDFIDESNPVRMVDVFVDTFERRFTRKPGFVSAAQSL